MNYGNYISFQLRRYYCNLKFSNNSLIGKRANELLHQVFEDLVRQVHYDFDLIVISVVPFILRFRNLFIAIIPLFLSSGSVFPQSAAPNTRCKSSPPAARTLSSPNRWFSVYPRRFSEEEAVGWSTRRSLRLLAFLLPLGQVRDQCRLPRTDSGSTSLQGFWPFPKWIREKTLRF